MIWNQWYAVLESVEVKKLTLLGVTRLGEKLVFWRDKKSNVFCLKDKCAHRGAKLSIGKTCEKGNTVQCPFHGLRYDSSGKCTIIPANGRKTSVPERFKVNSYNTKEDMGFIWIWWGDPQKVYPSLPSFKEFNDKSFKYKTHTEIWPVHYSRAIENQLDVVHLPFVHSSTIGKGMGKIVHGPLVEVSEDKRGFKIWVKNQKDDGKTVAIKPENFPPEYKKVYLHFKFPHIWQNHITDKMRIFIAFVPINDNSTKFYMRTYQKYVKVPIFKNIVNYLAKRFSIVILHQDRTVVITQQPIKTKLKMEEKLIQGDLPIVKYRQRREELINEKTFKT